MKPTALRLTLATLAVAIGILAVIAGGYDDSPGLQFIGVIIIATALTLTARSARRHAANDR